MSLTFVSPETALDTQHKEKDMEEGRGETDYHLLSGNKTNIIVPYILTYLC